MREFETISVAVIVGLALCTMVFLTYLDNVQARNQAAVVYKLLANCGGK